MKHDPQDRTLILSLLYPLIGGFGGYFLIETLSGNWAYKHWLQMAIALVSVIPFLVAGHRIDKQRQQEAYTEDEAIAEWEKLNPPPA